MITVGVFFGGSSVEHEISIISAVQAMGFIDKEKYVTIPVYISKTGEFYTGEALTEMENYADLPALFKRITQVALVRCGKSVVLQRVKRGMFERGEICSVDIALPIVHGTFCEDGSLMGLFELLRLPYSGCDVTSSAVCMDKAVTKDMLRCAGIPIVPHKVINRDEFRKDKRSVMDGVIKDIGFPTIIKPANLGSSVGIKKARDESELESALELASSFSQKLLAEHCVEQLLEVNCSVLGDKDGASVSVLEEPVGSDEILSYNDKYLSGGKSKGMASLGRKIPADVTDDIKKSVTDMAKRAFSALGLCGVVRIDFMIDKQTDTVYLNEVNTIPGSLSFYLWKPMGKDYKELLDDLIKIGLKRERERQKLTFTYDTNILKNSKFGGKTPRQK